MIPSADSSGARLRAFNTAPAPFHPVAWRWHFYAGLYVVPFLLMLAITGAVMVFFTGFETRLGMTVNVAPQGVVQPVSLQAQAARRHLPQATLATYTAPENADVASWFVMKQDGATHAVAINPYTAKVLKLVDKDNTVFAWAESIHGTLLIGALGDALIEIAAGLSIVLLVTGLYMWWPRGVTRWLQVLVPNLRAGGRLWWRSLHASLGFWQSAVLSIFLITGMTWTGVWGAKLVQPWNSFPATKWYDIPLSDTTHAALNSAGQNEVPWGLEQTPLPASGSHQGLPGVPAGQPVDIDTVAELAAQLGFRNQHHIHWPQDETGVFSISADSMSGDLTDPTQDRTVHVDRYTGRVLAEAAFADYGPVAKAMAVATAFHQGDLGKWNAWFNLLFCLGTVLLCISGIVMWWKRRPVGAARLVAPPMPANVALWRTGSALMVLVGVCFPLTGLVLLAVWLIDSLLLARVVRLRALLS